MSDRPWGVWFTTRRLTALAVAAGTAVTMSACGGSGGGSSTPPPTAERLVDTSPAKGDVDSFTWDLPNGEPGTLYPPHTYDYSPATVLSNLCEGLLGQNSDLTVANVLAESFTHPDPVTYVFKLRDGVTFWNGAPLTAEDVVYSLRMHLDPEVATYYAVAYASVGSVDATGPLEVTVKLTRPDNSFIEGMTTGAGPVGQKAFMESSGAAYGTASGGLMCTGPFKFKSWSPGNEIVMDRNDGYWDTKHRAHARSVTFKFLTNNNTLSQALNAGEIDGSFAIPPAGAPALRTSSTGKLYSSSVSTIFTSLTPARDTGPIADVRIRRALSMAIDRKGIADGVLPGMATPLDWVMPPTNMVPPMQNPEASAIYEAAHQTVKNGSLDEARQLVADAGSPQQPLVLAIPEGSETERRIATAIQAAATSVGLKIELKTLTPAELNTVYYDAKTREGIDLLWGEDSMQTATPLSVLPTYFGPTATVNMLNYQNTEVNNALVAATKTDDPVQQARLLAPAIAQLANDAAMIPLFAMNANTFLNNRLTGVTLTAPYYATGPWAAAIGSAE